MRVMKSGPSFLSINESNDTGLEKVNPITVHLYDIKLRMVVTRFLDMCIKRVSAMLSHKISLPTTKGYLNWGRSHQLQQESLKE